MSRYLNTVYGTDTYGIRVRAEIPMSVTNYDYGKVLLTLGEVSQDAFPVGTRIVISRSLFYWPRPPLARGAAPDGDQSVLNPDDFNVVTGMDYTDMNALPEGVFGSPFGSAFQGNYDPTILWGGNIGYATVPTEIYDDVPEDSVVYYRVYVTEPMMITNPLDVPQVFQDHMDYLISSGQVPEGTEITGIWSPWEVRGQAYGVSAGQHGGKEAAIDAFPNGIMTGGDVFGVPDEDSPQYQFITSLGFLSDVVSTDGMLIIDRPELSHPNMVKPMLEAFGMTPDEDAAVNAQFATWNREFESPRLKALMYAYRNLTLRKGTKDAIGDYMWLAYGIPGVSVSNPENMVLTVTDSSPRDFFSASSLMADLGEGEMAYSACDNYFELPNTSITVSGSNGWTRQPVYDATAVAQGSWSDVFSQQWNVGPQDSLYPQRSDAPGELGYIPPVVDVPGSTTDDWALSIDEVETYDQFTDYVYQIAVKPNGLTAAIGTREVEVFEPNLEDPELPRTTYRKPDFQCSIPIQANVAKYWVRARVMRQVGQLSAAYIVVDWLDDQGSQITRERFTVAPEVLAAINADREWHELSNSGEELHGRPPERARYMAWRVEFRVADVDNDGAVVCVGAAHISWLDLDVFPVYRNPRSVVALVQWPANVSVDQRIALAKTEQSLVERIPANVDYRILTSESTFEYNTFISGPPLVEITDTITFSDTRVKYGDDAVEFSQPEFDSA